MQENEHSIGSETCENDLKIAHESTIPQIKLNDEIISQLFARGELSDLASLCLNTSRQLLQPELVGVTMSPATCKPNADEWFEPEINAELKLPRFKKIEEVITLNKQLVLEHILRKREAKFDFKSENRYQKVMDNNYPNANQDHHPDQYAFDDQAKPSDLGKSELNIVLRIDEIDFSIIKQFTSKDEGNKSSEQLNDKQRKLDRNNKSQQAKVQKTDNQLSTENQKITRRTSTQKDLLSFSKKNSQSMLIKPHDPLVVDTGFNSRTETESEDSADSEDEKFEKKLNRKTAPNSSIKPNEPLTQVNVRPRRTAAINMNYQQQKSHEHSHYQLNQKERQKNVELCPLSADRARQQIQSRGQILLGWYHSHPFFPVEPSLIDIKNHSVYQQNFDLENLPFVALIIGPYSVKNRTDSLMKIFHLVNECQPYNLNFRQIPSTKLRKSLIEDVKELFEKYQNHQDTIDLQDKWSPNMTREVKLFETLQQILDKNLSQKDRFNLQNEILKNLDQTDVNRYFNKNSINSFNSVGSGAEFFQKPIDLDDQAISSQGSKKNSFFSIENDEKIEKFMNKLQKMLLRHLYGESSDSEEADDKPK